MEGLKINILKNRIFDLSPTIKAGNDKECSIKDFTQTMKSNVNLGKLGDGIIVEHQQTKIKYSIRIIPKDTVIKKSYEKKFNNFIDFLYKVSHPFILRLLNHFEDEKNIYFIIEGSDYITLKHKLNSQPQPNEELLLKYFIEIMIGVQHLHNFNMFNVCIFPERVLIDQDNFIKITDFGWNLTNSSNNTRQVYNIKGFNITTYTSPEELNAFINKAKFSHSKKSDSWNLGVLLYELFTNGKSPFKGTTVNEMANQIQNCIVDVSLIQNQEIQNLISKLLVKDPMKRISIEDISQCDFLRSIEIDIPELEENDCVISPEVVINDNLLGGYRNNYDYDTMTSLKMENEKMKKELEKYRNYEQTSSMKMSQAFGETMDFNKASISLEESKKYDELTSSCKYDDNTTVSMTALDIANKEKSLEERIKSMQEEQADDELYLRRQIRILEDEKDLLQTNYDEEKQLTDELENKLIQLEKDKFNFEEKAKLKVFDKIEEAIASSSDPIKARDLVIASSLTRFNDSMHLFQEIIQKYIDQSPQANEALFSESQKFMIDKAKILFDVLEKMKNSTSINTEDNTLSSISKEEERELNKKKDEWAKKIITSLYPNKTKLQTFINKEEQLTMKLKEIEAKCNENEEVYKERAKKCNELERINDILIDEKDKSEQQLSQIKLYIPGHISSLNGNYIEEFFNLFKFDLDQELNSINNN